MSALSNLVWSVADTLRGPYSEAEYGSVTLPFTVLRRLRAEGSTTPVLMLTARSDLSDRVNGLDFGADYYLTKPFEPKELLACVRALTRRQPELRQTDALEYGDLRLEKTSFTLSCGERSVRLSRKEFDMMEMLMLNRKLVITKEKLQIGRAHV